MAIQYSGSTLVNFTFTDSNTRLSLVNNLNTQLKNAGWTAVSGDGTGDVLMESATTPQGFKIRFRLLDPGSGNCAQVTMKDASQTSSIAFILPGTRNWRIVANKYQFFMFVQGATNASADRGMIMGGVPWAPSFATGTYFGWMQFISQTDTTSFGGNFRSIVCPTGTGMTGSGLLNGSLGNYSGLSGGPGLIMPRSTNGTCLQYRWEDGSPMMIEAIIGWAFASGSSSESRSKGVLWDSALISLEYSGESTITFDGHTWIAITHNDSANHGTLFIVVA